MNRNFSKWTARIGIIAMMMAQFALAAYACPLASGAHAHAAVTIPMPAGAEPADCCDQDKGVVSGVTGLCHEHCKDSKLVGADAAPVLPEFIAAYSISLPRIEADVPSVETTADAVLVLHPPPLTVLHCCFRI